MRLVILGPGIVLLAKHKKPVRVGSSRECGRDLDTGNGNGGPEQAGPPSGGPFNQEDHHSESKYHHGSLPCPASQYCGPGPGPAVALDGPAENRPGSRRRLADRWARDIMMAVP